LGKTVDDAILVPIVLQALPFRYKAFVTTLNVTKHIPSFEELVNLLQKEESLRQDCGEDEEAYEAIRWTSQHHL
jgi:hypothetical protein